MATQTTEKQAAPREREEAPVVLQSPKKGLNLVLDMGEAVYLPSGGYRVGRHPRGLSFERGVCSVSREKWESLGFKTREAFLDLLRQWQRKGAEFVIREDLERLSAGRSAEGTPPLVIPK